jgi:mono/diheme cytochrome c family protein
LRPSRTLLALPAFWLVLFTNPCAAQQATPAERQFFENQVRPILANNCFRCHGPEKHRSNLRLDSRAAVLTGGDSGPAVVPGKPDESPMIKAVNYRDLEMPPGKRLGKKDVAALTEWVKMGAPWPASGRAEIQTPRPQGIKITDEDRKFWAFQPVTRPVPPLIDGNADENPIDAFIARKLQEKRLSFSPPASKQELIRRAYFDLIGLPPTPEDIDAFVADRSPGAYARLIDRLLSMPQYGERWGRHWLDVVRFAQTNGYERDSEKPEAWRYRDYVIRSLNDDKPYDRFVREQLAGDELSPVSDDAVTATAFYRLGVWDDEPDDKRQAVFDELDDMLSTTSTAFLGLALGCARCHDHKFDPISQEDYYGMLAFLRNIRPYSLPAKGGSDAEFIKLAAGGRTLAVREFGPTAPPTRLLVRGSAATPAKEVSPRFVTVLCKSDSAAVPKVPAQAASAKTSGRRSVLADWIASRDNPLTARVLVNRLWHYHFGRGLVATPSDFGHTGMPPTHPELLDWLASEFIEGGWKLKRMHRLIMGSRTYQQSARVSNDKAVASDPGNTLLWRQNLRRLEAEAIRDAILAASGQLNPKMGGRGVFPTLSREVLSTQSHPGLGWDTSSKEEQTRRSVYIFVKRTLGVPLLETFDVASADTPTAARTTTTIAPQALLLLNGSFVEEQATALADRLLGETGHNPEKNVQRLFRLALGRLPSGAETTIALNYLERARQDLFSAASGVPWDDAARYRRALAMLSKVVLNLNEMVYVD